MLGRTTRLAPAVVGALITGLAMDCAAARAEPAVAATAPAATAADDCLAAPNRTSPTGTHWYYRIDRNSGRHCWYLRPTIEGRAHQQPAAGERAVAPHPVSAPAHRASAATAPDKPAARAEAAPVPSSMISAPSAFPSSNWPMPAPSTPPLASATASASATDSSSAVEPTPPPAAADANIDSKLDSKIDAPAPDPAPAPMPRIAPKPPAEQPRRHAAEFEHIPALLGTGLVLVLILLGSLAFRIAARVLRRPRRHAFQEAAVSRWDDAYADAPLAPHMADARPDITDVRPDSAPPLHPDDWVSDDMPERREPIAEPRVAPQAEPATSQSLFDADVRELLRRLPTALAKGPGLAIRVERDRAPPAAKRVPAPPLVPGDLNAALASWQGRRR